jgi:Fe-S oxidoreductase
MALLVTSQRRGLATWNAETVDIVFSEVDGGNSRAHCATDQPFEEAMAAVRAELVAQELAPMAVTQLHTYLQQWQNPYAPQLPQATTGEGETALFVGDEAVYLWPETMPAVLKLLSLLGIEPVLVGHGRNNGFLAQSAGFPELARHLAHKNLEEVQAAGAHTLLVLSAGDLYALNGVSAGRLGMAQLPGLTVREVTAFLAEQLVAGKLACRRVDDGMPTAYVDPTHAVRVPERHEKVRRLVTAVLPTPLRELFWRKDRAQPVGSTYLQFANPALAERLTRARLQDAQNSGAKLLICEDPATLFHLNRYAGEYGLRVRGLYELLAQQVIGRGEAGG